MAKLNKIEKTTNNKFLNMYDLHYTNEKTGKDFIYHLASRQANADKLVANTKDHTTPDAVMMFCFDTKKECIYLIKQFRPAINDYILESPAGLIDEGETVFNAIGREIFEETGLTALECTCMIDCAYTSEGMSDEKIGIYLVKVTGTPNTDNLDGNEDIEVLAIGNDEIEKVYNGDYGIVSLKTRMILEMISTQ